jgi:transposase
LPVALERPWPVARGRALVERIDIMDEDRRGRMVHSVPRCSQSHAAKSKCPGRKPVPTREVLEAALWILNTGAQWHMLPQCYPNYKTVHRRFQWCEREVLREVLTQLGLRAARMHLDVAQAILRFYD